MKQKWIAWRRPIAVVLGVVFIVGFVHGRLRDRRRKA